MILNESEIISRPISEYEEESKNDLYIPIEHLMVYIRDYPRYLSKWNIYLNIENTISNRMESKLEILYKELYRYYTYKYKPEDIEKEKIDNKNIDIYIKSDKKYNECNRLYKDQKIKERFIEKTLDYLKSFGYLFKTIQNQIALDGGLILPNSFRDDNGK